VERAEVGTVPTSSHEENPMTQYMLGVHHASVEDLPNFPPDEMQALFESVDAFNAEVQAAGKWVFGGGLELPDTATVVRNNDGDVLLTDGPFIETKEFLGGFWVIEAADLDEALDWAKRASVACRGDVEVRPFQAEPPAES
jgi:hypothetical protein